MYRYCLKCGETTLDEIREAAQAIEQFHYVHMAMEFRTPTYETEEYEIWITTKHRLNLEEIEAINNVIYSIMTTE